MVATSQIVGMRLLDFVPGQSGTVMQFSNEYLAGKLMAMGILPESPLQLVRQAPLGGGWIVRTAYSFIALRKEEVACIIMK